MNTMKKSFSILLSVVLLLSSLSTTLTVSASDEAQDITGTIGNVNTTGIVEDEGNSATGVTFQKQFKENWEQGLSLDKWYVEKLEDSYVSDFRVVDDPLGVTNKDGTINQVITSSRLNTWLVPTDEYWPTSGLYAGEITKISFRMYVDEPTLVFEKRGWQMGDLGFAAYFVSPEEMLGYHYITEAPSQQQYPGIAIRQIQFANGYTAGTGSSNQLSEYDTQYYYAPKFDFNGWLNVTVNLTDGKNQVTIVDQNGVSVMSEKWAFNISEGGKYAVGNRLMLLNRGNAEQTNGVFYIDDIVVDFKQSNRDLDTEQADAVAYYAGNTFLNPGDTLNITGEKLGTTVLNAQLIKLDDEKLTDISGAKCVNETTFEKAEEDNVTWEELLEARVIDETTGSDSLIKEFTIEQRTELGLKMILPDGNVAGQEMYRTPGMYAVLLETAHPDGKDEIVIVNNPQIGLLLQDDGDFATSNGWLKISGSNLSVQNDVSKVSAIILDGETRIPVDNRQIEVDTTENNLKADGSGEGVANDYYMMVNLEDLEPGDYQIMVHNGYGGDYGWSMPFDFHVEEKGWNMQWREKGTFNVRDYGAVGNGNANDTAAIMRAICAAHDNDGGMIYFPKNADGTAGKYRVTSTLIVGENISFVGDGTGNSMLFYTGFLQTEKQQSFITFERNFEIADLYVTCETNSFANVIDRSNLVNDEPGKLYFRDSVIQIDPTGACSNGIGTIMQGNDCYSARNFLNDFWGNTGQNVYRNNKVIEIFCTIDDCFLNMTHLEGEYENDTDGGLSYETEYTYIDGLNPEVPRWSPIHVYNTGFIENSEIPNALSSNTHYRNVTATNGTNNNDEMLTSDTGCQATSLKIQPLLEDEYSQKELEMILLADKDEKNSEKWTKLLQDVGTYLAAHKGKVYRLINYKADYNGYIAVQYGQGAGQVRRMSNMMYIGSSTYFTVEEPFAVVPNRSSEVAYSQQYFYSHDMVVNNLYVYNGGSVQMYGQGMNGIFDNVVCKQSTAGVGLVAIRSGYIWYATVKNISSQDILNMHTTNGDQIAAGVSAKGGFTAGNIILGIRYSNCSFGEGAFINTASSGSTKVFSTDVVFEHLEIVSQSPALSVVVNSTAQGIWLRDIKQYTDKGKAYSEISPYNTRYTDGNTLTYGMTTYLHGTPLLWCDNWDLNYKRLRGDIDNDGIIGLQDVTFLRQVLGEKKTAAEFEKFGTYADITQNDIVDSCDFLYLRAYILGDEDAMAAIKAIDTKGSSQQPSQPDTPDVPDVPDYVIKEDGVYIDYTVYPKSEEED